ncbi:MAG: hypothetical protein AAF393_00775 [Pseudomonadota bacterium]
MKPLLLLLIGLSFGGGVGFLIAASQGVTLDGHDHSDPAQHGQMDRSNTDHSGHEGHQPLDLPAGETAPSLNAMLMKDAKGGWNLHLTVQNFRFAPEAVNQANADGEGHAHVYVDGRKISRLYSPWLHIDALPAGATVKVELNANDHSPLFVGGTPLTVELTVPSDQ